MPPVRTRIGAAVIGAATAAGVFASTQPAAAEPAASVSPAPKSETPSAQAKAMGVKIDLASATIGITNRIYDIAFTAIQQNQNRSGYVKSLMEGAFYDAGQSYNVVVVKADHPYSSDLNDVVYDATVQASGYPSFRVLVFESGVFTNGGDGGYINWAYRGWFDREGMTVTFHNP